MNSIHFLIPKLLIALSHINADPVLTAGLMSSQENFYGRLNIWDLNVVRNHHSQLHSGRLCDNGRERNTSKSRMSLRTFIGRSEISTEIPCRWKRLLDWPVISVSNPRVNYSSNVTFAWLNNRLRHNQSISRISRESQPQCGADFLLL